MLYLCTCIEQRFFVVGMIQILSDKRSGAGGALKDTDARKKSVTTQNLKLIGSQRTGGIINNLRKILNTKID